MIQRNHSSRRLAPMTLIILWSFLSIVWAQLIVKPELSNAIIAIQQIFVTDSANQPQISMDGRNGDLSLNGTLSLLQYPCTSTSGCVLMLDENGKVILTGADAWQRTDVTTNLSTTGTTFFAKRWGSLTWLDTSANEIIFWDPSTLTTSDPISMRVGVKTINSTTSSNNKMLDVAGSINTRKYGLTLQAPINPTHKTSYNITNNSIVESEISRRDTNNESIRMRIWYNNWFNIISNLIFEWMNPLAHARLGINTPGYPTRELDVAGNFHSSQTLTVGSGSSPLFVADTTAQRVAINTTPTDHSFEVKGTTRLWWAVNFAGIATNRSNTTDGKTSVKLWEINSLETTPYTYTGMWCKYLSVDAQWHIILVQWAGSGCGATPPTNNPTAINGRCGTARITWWWNGQSAYNAYVNGELCTSGTPTDPYTEVYPDGPIGTASTTIYVNAYRQCEWANGGTTASCYDSTTRRWCFVDDTLVTMADGTTKPIQTIVTGDLLQWSRGINTVVSVVQYNHSGPIYSFNGGEYFVTEAHPFMTTEGRQSINPEATKILYPDLEVTTLRPGSIMITDHGEIPLFIIQSKHTIEPVYTFTVDGSHDFYADGYLVHNKRDDAPTAWGNDNP